ncbi:hypothetical protein ACFSSB_12635 [Lacinutrix gracilariae]|uniref:Lipoprotein n=1 Tax=Lacinutrix gracilariae TaxID=1747198 RepID=A0ABW5K5Z3_9FLAO
MKEKTNIRASSIFPVLGLVVLLLISPCKVRNFLQAQLDIPQTEVTNKSQTSISSSNCNELNIFKSSSAKEKPVSQNAFATLTKFEFPCEISNFPNIYPRLQTSRNNSSSAIPLYILYQNYKDYL